MLDGVGAAAEPNILQAAPTLSRRTIRKHARFEKVVMIACNAFSESERAQ
jgi:hypothetical protein